MRQLPITECWNETLAFVSREAGLLFPVAFALIALPAVVFQFVSPRPEVLEQSIAAGATVPPGPWILLVIPVILLSLLGTLTISSLALTSGQTVGQALAHGARRLLATLGAVALLVVIGMLIMLPFGVIAGLMAGGNATVASAILTPIMLAIFILLGVRMIFIYPVAAVERVGPIGILRRNWTLTRGHGFKLFAFLVFAVLVMLVIMLAVTFVFGTLLLFTIGSPQESDLALLLQLLVSGAVNTAVTVYFFTMTARLYAKAAA